MRPSGGRKSSQNAGGRGGRNRGGSSGSRGVGADVHNYHLNGKLTLDDISTSSYLSVHRLRLNDKCIGVSLAVQPIKKRLKSVKNIKNRRKKL